MIAATSTACLLAGAIAGWKRPQPGRAGHPGGIRRALAGTHGSNRAGTRSPNKTPPKSSSAMRSCKRLATIGPRPFSPSSGISRILMRSSRRPTPSSRGSGTGGSISARWERWKRELSNWKDATKHDQELIEAVRIAIKLKKGDLEAVVEGMKNLMRDDVPDMFDPALVEMNMEICADAINGGSKDGDGIIAGKAPRFPGAVDRDGSIRSRSPRQAGCRRVPSKNILRDSRGDRVGQGCRPSSVGKVDRVDEIGTS